MPAPDPRVRVTVEVPCEAVDHAAQRCPVCADPLTGQPTGKRTILATPTPETAALIADGEWYRALKADWLAAAGHEECGDGCHGCPTCRQGGDTPPETRPSPDTEGGNG